MENVGLSELLILSVVGTILFLPLALLVVAVVTAAATPLGVWRRAGHSRSLWATTLLAGILLPPAGFVTALVWAAVVLPSLRPRPEWIEGRPALMANGA